MWRELHRGQTGPDVEALQRCLWQALGTLSTNARNGTYGKQTAVDVARARTHLHLPGGSETVGSVLFSSLWPFADARAVALYGHVPAGVEWAPGLKRNPLSKGMTGSDVEAAQRGLWRLLGDKSRNARNGVYGDQTETDVVLARAALELQDPVGGAVIGGTLWAALTRWFDAAAIKAAEHAPAAPPPAADLRAKVVDQARWALEHADSFRYAQIRPMPASLHNPGTTLIDCSAFSILCHHDAGLPNPNRVDGEYDGSGWTGSIEAVCREVDEPLPGDFAMYDGHMAVVETPNGHGDASVISDGHDPITRYTTARYRSDFRAFRRSPHLA